MTIRAPLPWIFEEVTHLGDSQSYRVLSSVPNPPAEYGDDGGYGNHWSDVGKDQDSLIFHDYHYYSMAPNKDDAAFIVRACNLHHELLEALKNALLIVSDRAAGGRMITPVKEAKSVFQKALTVIRKAGEP